ncbi:TPA: hypothetical protein ACH3X1_005929 [Trebouxia sp. C0004]
MWGRIGGVAGNIRTNVSQLAKDVLEGDEDSPRQEPRHAPTSQNFVQQPLPQSGGVSQRPYYQPAAAGIPPRAQPTMQQQKVSQQIPFLPQPTAGARAGAKPALFVPSQNGSRTNPVLTPKSTSTSTNGASTGPRGVLEPRQTPAVSSRLSALKARLDSEKHRSSGDDMQSGPRSLNANQPTRPSFHSLALSSGGSAPPSRPQIPFMSSTSSRKPHADTAETRGSDLVLNQQQGLSPGRQRPSAKSQQAVYTDQLHPGPAKRKAPAHPLSASSQHQLPDLGFEDVDLDSPDAALSKSRSNHAVPSAHSHIMPIPFMQPSMQDTSPSAMAAADFTASMVQYPAEHDADELQDAPGNSAPSAACPFASPEQALSADLGPDEADGHITLSRGMFEGGPPAASPEPFQVVSLAARAGPFSTYSGPPSTTSSTPASPAGSSTAPLRRPSFLPRGMSTHLQKALRATAAAASKASAAIAPLPNGINSASSHGTWQADADGKHPQALPNQEAGPDQGLPSQQQWGQSGPASTSSSGTQDVRKEGKPWWQQQLRNLQHNLQSSQQLQSDVASESDADIANGEADMLFGQPSGQAAWAAGVNDDEQPPDASAWEASHYFAPQGQGEFASQLSPQHISSEQQQVTKKYGQLQQHDSGLNSMSIVHHLPNEQDINVPGSGLASKAAAAQSAHEPVFANELSADANMQTAGLQNATLHNAQDYYNASPSSQDQDCSLSAQLVLNKAAESHTDADSAEPVHAPDPGPFDIQTPLSQAVSTPLHEDDGRSADLSVLGETAGDTAQMGLYQHDHPKAVTDQTSAMSNQLLAEHGSPAELSHQASSLQQQLAKSQDRCRHLEAAVNAREADQASKAKQHDEQSKSVAHLHQQQIQSHQHRAAQQQSQLDNMESKVGSLQQQLKGTQQQAQSWQQQLQSAQQQAQSLQQQASQQQQQLSESSMRTADLDRDLHAVQQQLKSAKDALASQLKKADSYTREQLEEQQQTLMDTQQALQSTQAELQSAQSELASSNQQVLTARQQADRNQQSFTDRDAVWQEELQQQQAKSDQLQAELDQLKSAHGQLQVQYQELSQQFKVGAESDEHSEAVAHLTQQLQQANQDLAGQRAKTMALQQVLEDQGEEIEAAQTAAVSSAAASEDLHASLEGQLRASHADVGRLQSEVKRLKSAAESAAAAIPASPPGTSEFLQSAKLESQLQESQASVKQLQAEVKSLKGEVSASIAVAATGVDSPVSRDGSQTASVSGRYSGSRALLPNGNTQGLIKGQDADGHEGPGIAPAEGLPQGTNETYHLQQRLAAVEKERDKAKQQLNRLKQELMTEQEEEEEKLRWRVDAEVKLALEEFQKAEAQRGAGSQGEVAELKVGMDSANAQIQQMHEDLQAWEQAVAARDAELRNLQAALGELTFESEAANRMRGEVRSAQHQVDHLQHQLQQSAQQVQSAQQAQAQAQQLAADASNGTQEQQRLEKQLQDEAAMLRRALNESMRRVESLSDEGLVQVDRRIVVKLLVTFFEKGQSQDVLSLMARILAFTDDDKARVGLTQPRKGVFSRVAGVLSLSSSSARQAADESLADQWLDFLIQQADAADAAETAAGVSKDTSSAQPGSALNVNLEANRSLATRPLHDWNSMQSPKA